MRCTELRNGAADRRLKTHHPATRRCSHQTASTDVLRSPVSRQTRNAT